MASRERDEHARRSGDGQTRGAPETLDQALARSLGHAGNSASEAVLVLRALMDALSIDLVDKTVAEHAEPDSPLAKMSEGLETWADALRIGSKNPSREAIDALLDALDHQIWQWEAKSRNDDDARGVLRAFLGIREIVWELGMALGGRPSETKAKRGGKPRTRRAQPSRRGSSRPRSRDQATETDPG